MNDAAGLDEDLPDPDSIRAALTLVLESPGFQRSVRLSQLFRYLVEETLAGRGDALSEYSIALAVFGRGDLDPSHDTIVRSQARRLRQRLTAYYAGVGPNRGVEITLPKGGYVPRFRVLNRNKGEGRLRRFTGLLGGEGRNLKRLGLAALASVALIVGVVSWKSVQSSMRMGDGVYRNTPLNAWVGPEFSTGWAPDGRSILVSRLVGGGYDLFEVPRGGGSAIRLIESPTDECCASWSPDGRWLAYLSDEDDFQSVFAASAAGAQSRKLASTGLHRLNRFEETYLALGSNPWSPDGGRVTYSRLGSDGRIRLWEVGIEDEGESSLSSPSASQDDFQGTWSPDGKNLAFLRREEGRYSLWTQVEGRETMLLSGWARVRNPAWMPDGEALVFEAEKDGRVGVWEIRLSTGRVVPLTAGSGWQIHPIVSHAGEIAYTQHRRRMEVRVLDVASGAEVVAASSNERLLRPRISPAGDRVLFQSRSVEGFDIVVRDLKSDGQSLLVGGPSDDQGADWSPDGRSVVFVSDRSGSPRLWVKELSGGEPSLLTDVVRPVRERGQEVLIGPKWSPDGARVGCLGASEAGLALWSIDPITGEAEVVATGLEDFAWYKDSRRILFTPVRQSSGEASPLMAANLESGGRRVVSRTSGAELATDPGGSNVSFVGDVSRSTNALLRLALRESLDEDGLPVAVGEPETLTQTVGHWRTRNGGWSWDGRSIAYVRNEVQANVYLLERQ